MFGFEVFDVNSFEQLVSTSQTTSQGFFQQCVFHAEEEVHRLEGVPWPKNLEYQDTVGASLVTKSIFQLDESCSLQNSTESTFMRISGSVAATRFSQLLVASALRGRGLVIRHFCRRWLLLGGSCGIASSQSRWWQRRPGDATPASADSGW